MGLVSDRCVCQSDTECPATASNPPEPKMSNQVDDGLKKEIEAGTKLKDVPEPETKINSHDVTLFAVENFKKDKLKEVKTEEKSVLPTAEDIAAEKAESS